MMSTLAVSPQMIAWAAQSLGTSVDALASSMASPKRQDRFKDGQLTQTQATQLAAKLKVPFGFLFLSTPPVRHRSQLPDLRQTLNPEPLGEAFFEALQDIETKMAWYRSRLLEGEASPLAFIGRFKADSKNAQAIAADISKTIGFNEADRQSCVTHEALYAHLADKFEAVRVLIFRTGVAKGNPHRPLPVSEFRGFAIADNLAPVVFINGRDSPAAWLFTLIHEVAHLWLGASGVSDVTVSNELSAAGLEALCNQVAAEFLTPEAQFRHVWQGDGHYAIQQVAKYFKVSRLVVARRALAFRLIDQQIYREVWAMSQPKKNDDGGGNPYATIPIRSSRRFTRAVMDSAMAGETMLREAGRLLNVRPDTVVELYRRQADQ